MLPASNSFEQIVSKPRLDSYRGYWNMLIWIGKQRPSLLAKILPGHPMSRRGATSTWFEPKARWAALGPFIELAEVRNRVAHHEPLWKFSAVFDTGPVPPIALCAASTDEASTLVRFARLMALYDSTVDALSPAMCAALQTSSWRMKLDFLLSTRGLQRFKDRRHVVHPIAIDAMEFGSVFAEVMQDDRPVKVIHQGYEGLFVPR